MKKSIIVAFIIIIAVVGWFLSAQFKIDKNSNKENLNKNNNKDISIEKLIDKNDYNIIKVESKLFISEEIIKSS